MPKNVNDGVYVGELCPEQVITQFEYRILIHESYAGLVQDDPATYAGFGSFEYHLWAINGYEWGIKYIKEHNPVAYKCTLSEAMVTIGKAIIGLFRR